MSYEELIKEFISKDKSLLVSPAGYGKTYTVAKCVLEAEGKSLILTHTHAGIASIKKKLKDLCVPIEKYQVETITSYAQKYVKSYFTGEIPEQEDNKYWSFILNEAEKIFKISHIKDVIKASYDRLFVDEYQDCTISQHNMIMTISDVLPTHILGDPLQGIMGFDKEDLLVDFDKDLNYFNERFKLIIPHRWYQVNNKELGDSLKNIRDRLEKNEEIDFSNISELDFHKTDKNILDCYSFEDSYIKSLSEIVKKDETSLLLLMPEYTEKQRIKENIFDRRRGGVTDRLTIKNKIDFQKQLELLEAIDAKDFYSNANKVDDLIKTITNARKKIKKISFFLEIFFNKTDIAKWINEDNIKNKPNIEDKVKAKVLNECCNKFITEPCAKKIYNLLVFCKNELRLKIKRPTLYNSIKSCLLSEEAEITIYKAMINQRNKMRRVGRRVEGKCIGTTALTKGLEFDTVVVLDAHNFKDPENLYVALTRASKKLIVFSKQEILKYD